jgi:hypothetical protein
VGKGIDMARAAGASIHADALDDFKDQLLVVFLKRLQSYGDNLAFPVLEVDNTGRDLVSFRIDQITRTFHFELGKKS